MALYNDSLRVHSTLDINTEDGTRQIQLLFGDITALPKQHEVDVLLISAFPGDYTPTRTSLIGALQHSLDIRVRDLANDKEEDLRRQLHCWWSKPLPRDKPFRRIMCFEPFFGQLGRVIRHPAELVGEVFRCLVPVCNQEEKTVLSPLLATGDANFSPSVMLRSMLKAAVSWIEAGLAMKRLGIVVYTRRPDQLYNTEKDLASLFDDFKTRLEKKLIKRDKITTNFDIYVVYHDEDKERVTSLCKKMQERKIQLFLKQQTVNTEVEWQEDIHKTMLASNRVVAFLSPAFLCSLTCIEKLNIALVCGHSLKRNFLTPFMIRESSPIPTYIAMIQFVDCRTYEKQERTLPPFLEALTLRSSTPERPLTQRYDVFISYAHVNTDCAQMVLKALADVNPLLSVFYDRNELRAGSGWQKTLYSALDSSSVVLVLLSPNYLDSLVCQEEYNIALANYLSDDHECELVSIQVKPISMMPKEFSLVPYADASNNFQDVVDKMCDSISDFVSRRSRNDEYFHYPKTVNLYQALESWRAQNYTASNNKSNRNVHFNTDTQDNDTFEVEKQEKDGVTEHFITFKQPPSEDNIDIAFIGGSFTLLFFLFRLLKFRAPELTTNIHLRQHSKRLASIDKARLVVAFLSPDTKFTDIEELHVAIARHRSTFDRPVLFCIQAEKLARFPTFLHLLPCHIALQDQQWKDMEYSEPPDISKVMSDLNTKLAQDFPQEVGKVLSVATDEIIDLLSKKEFQGYKSKTLNNMQEITRESYGKQEEKTNEDTHEVHSTKLLDESKQTTADVDVHTQPSHRRAGDKSVNFSDTDNDQQSPADEIPRQRNKSQSCIVL